MDQKTAFIIDRLNELAHDIQCEYRSHWDEEEVLMELKTYEQKRVEAVKALKDQGVASPINKRYQINFKNHE